MVAAKNYSRSLRYYTNCGETGDWVGALGIAGSAGEVEVVVYWHFGTEAVGHCCRVEDWNWSMVVGVGADWSIWVVAVAVADVIVADERKGSVLPGLCKARAGYMRMASLPALVLRV